MSKTIGIFGAGTECSDHGERAGSRLQAAALMVGVPIHLRTSAAKANGRSNAMQASAYHPGTARVSIRLIRL
jgi:hypothetical protein